MNHLGHSCFSRRFLLAGLAALLCSACVTTSGPTAGAPGPSGPPSPTGIPSPTPGGKPTGTDPTSTSTGPKQGGYSVKKGTETGPIGNPDASPGAKGDPAGQGEGTRDADAGTKTGQPDATGTKSAQTGSSTGSPTGQGKSDDEILAEALEDLRRRNAGQSPQGEQAEGEGREPGKSGQPGEPGQPGQNGDPAAPGQAQTDEEKVRELHRELNERFAKFDQTILTETETVRREDSESGNRGFTDRDPYKTGDSGEGEQGQGAPGEPEPPNANLEKNMPGDMKTASNSGSNIPPDLVSAEGDDIIARQLREAAMKEQDPELRAKLWDEYRKYKRGMK